MLVLTGDDIGEPLASRRSHSQGPLGRIVSNLDEKDAEARYREEAADNGVGAGPPRGGSQTDASDGEETIVAWEEKDPENPYSWSEKRKLWILTTTMIVIVNSTMGSSLPSNAIPFMAKEWGVASDQEKVLPMSTYLIGYVLGPFLWAPLSEQFGRRDITAYTFLAFTLGTLACALSPNWAAFLFFRLFTGIFASAPIGVVTGIIADIYGDARSRGRAMAIFMSTTVFGPLLAPVISGFASSTIGWRWSFWIGLIYAGFSLLILATLPETYGPVLLLRRAKKIRKADPNARVVAPHELERKSLTELAAVVLTRPLRMIAFEPLVNTTCVYLALVYAIFYMSFQAFPIIFQGVYGLSPGVCGLTYMAIGVGSMIALPFFWWYDHFLARARACDAPWTQKEEYVRLPLACIGGPMFAISLFWLGWSARAEVSFVAPMLAGIPFGFGFVAIFMALLNYLTDAYEIFAASASAATSGARSLIATVLPLATTPMFARLGISGACSLLGGLSLLMSGVPFLFIWQGQNIRDNSPFCIALKERKKELERKVEEQRRRRGPLNQGVGEAGGSFSGSSGTEVATSPRIEKEEV